MDDILAHNGRSLPRRRLEAGPESALVSAQAAIWGRKQPRNTQNGPQAKDVSPHPPIRGRKVGKRDRRRYFFVFTALAFDQAE